MAIVKMKKLSVIGLQEEREAILRDLMSLGAVEISCANDKLQDEEWQQLVVRDGDEIRATEKDKELSRVQQAIGLINKYSEFKPSAFQVRRDIKEEEFDVLRSETDGYKAQTEEILELYEKLNHEQQLENAANSQIFALNPWINYELPLEEKTTDRLNIELGVFPPNTDVKALERELEEESYPCFLEEISKDKEQLYASFYYFKEDEDDVLDKLKKAGLSKPTFTDAPGTVTEVIERCKEDIEVHVAKKEQIIGQIAEKATYKEALENYHDILILDRDESQIRSNLVNTAKAFEFDGYVPAVAMPDVEKSLSEYFCSYEFSEPEEDDDVPTKLKLSKFLSPMEFIMKLYSLPNYREVDPTAIASIFYIIFFGIMFGDVGYGLMLIAGSLFAIKKFNIVEGAAGQLMKIIFYSGFSSIIWGFMFGSIFGDLIQVTGSTFFDKSIIIKPLWLDPGKEPMAFLAFSCGIGVVHLFIGMGIQAYQQIKQGKFLDACNDVFIWYAIVIGAIMWLFGGSVSPSLPVIGKWMVIVGLILAIILPIFIAKGAGKALGLWNIYSGLSGQLSDILSYSRLLGLGLASTSIAGVFNFLASMGGKTVVGVIMFIVIVLLGHLLNFAINALGAFVHSCRLQYVEFFGKFYEGEGREFNPFDRKTKYINII
ncbi:MAG TPA: V-type ATP synthase subunit I [Mogibacterium sp.]|nr:V-type ATP synthase subunit I [Mogibacterium sp.]